MAIAVTAILLTSFLAPAISQGSVYELMKDATGFSDNDIYLLAKVIRMYGHRNVDILKHVNLRLYEKIRDFNHRKYDILSSKSQDFINKMFEGAVGEYDRRPSYYTWPRLQTDFRALDSRYCIELITTFPALSRLGSCEKGSTVAPLPSTTSAPAVIMTAPSTCAIDKEKISDVKVHLNRAQNTLKRNGVNTAWNKTGEDDDIVQALDSLNLSLSEKYDIREVLDGIRNALRSPKGNKADDSSVPTRKVTMALMKASQSFVGALAKCYPDLFKFKEQIEKFAEDVRKKALTYKAGREDVACVLSSVYHAFA
ncbi:hypothetical protein RB195_011528 [Necator americanus]